MELIVNRIPYILILLLSSVTQQTQSKEILCLLGIETETAKQWNKVLLNELAAKGHHLTVITPSVWDLEKETNIEFIHLENTKNFLKLRYEAKNNTQNALDQSNWKLMVNWYDLIMATCQGNLESIGLSDAFHLTLKEKRSFDLIIYDVTYGPGCLLHMAYFFDRIPIVGITSSTLTSEILGINQNSVFNAAVDPYFLSHFERNMNYWKRLYNTALYGFDFVCRQWLVRPVIDGLWSHNRNAKQINVPKNLNDLKSRFKVILANHHPVLHTLQSLPPNIISVPGLHILANSSLNPTADLLKFIQNSKSGIVVVDLGLKELGENKMLTIYEVLRNFPKYGFVWKKGKHIKSPENKPNNLFEEEVLENRDLLSLPAIADKIKFVLTIPEILRIQECLYHGIPMITITLRPEQRYLAKRIEEQGFALNLQISDLGDLASSFEKVLTDKYLRNKARRLQQSFRNQQNSPLDTAVWWVETLLEYPQTNDHLLTANKDTVGFFAKNSLDIVLLLNLLIIMCIINMILVCKQTIQTFKKMSKTKRKSMEKKEEKVKKLKKDKKEKTKTL